MKQNTIWLVEMQEENNWFPTDGIGGTREEGRQEKHKWEKMNPDDRFRVRPYVPREGVKK